MKNILIIEDDENVRESMSELLILKDYNTSLAKNGQEGLSLAISNKPDLIICDVMMPGMTGYEVLNQLRLKDECATIPFIFLTARSGSMDIRQGMNLGADDYLTKPFKAKELFEAIESRLKRKGAEQREKIKILEPFRHRIIQEGIYNPLRGLRDSSELVLDYFENYDQDDIRAFVQKVNTSVHKLDRAVRNIIMYQSIEMGIESGNLQSVLPKGNIDIDEEVVRSIMLGVVKLNGREKDVFIKQVSNTRLPIQEQVFKTLIREVLHNAFDYSRPGQLVTLQVNLVTPYCEVIVEDKGYGIKRDKLEKLGGAPVLSTKGIGLGLYLVKKLIEITGGNVSIQSNYGEGTQVVLKIKIDQ